MAFSPAMRQVLGLGASWLLAGCAVVGSVFYSAEITGLARRMLVQPKAAAVTGLEGAAVRAKRPMSEVGGEVVIAAARGGHYLAEIEVNGARLDVLVDTGATKVALSYEDALRVGLSLRPGDFTQRVQTANGTALFAPVMLDRVRLGPIEIEQVTAAVAEPGRLAKSLLGMSFLGRLRRVDMRSGVMTLAE